MLAQLTIDKEEIQGFYYSNVGTIGAVTGRKRTLLSGYNSVHGSCLDKNLDSKFLTSKFKDISIE